MLNTLIQRAGELDYDTLRDVRDYLEVKLLRELIEGYRKMNLTPLIKEAQRLLAGVKLRRRGLTALIRLQLPKSMAAAEQLDQKNLQTFLEVLRALIDARKPVAGQRHSADNVRLARGSWEVKKREEYDKYDDVPLDEYGQPTRERRKIWLHYLYLRVYVVNHQNVKRSSSIYIGSLNRTEPKPFIRAVSNGDITKEDIIARYIEGGFRAVREWRRDMDRVEPDFAIDDEKMDFVEGRLAYWAIKLMQDLRRKMQ